MYVAGKEESSSTADLKCFPRRGSTMHFRLDFRQNVGQMELNALYLIFSISSYQCMQKSILPPDQPFYSKGDASETQDPRKISILQVTYRILPAYCLSIAATSSSISSIASPPKSGKSSAALLSFLFLAELPLLLLA